MFEHPFCNIVRELVDLLSDVCEECVARPTTDEHDSVDGDFIEVHGHRSSGSDGVCAELS